MSIITTGNSKLSAAIPSINLPAGITCRTDAPCFKECYAKHGTFLCKNVQTKYRQNLDMYMTNPQGYFDQIITELRKPLIVYKYVRWHSSGDIVDYAYLEGIVRVAQKCKTIKFLCFTKKYSLVNRYLMSGHTFPKNLHIVFSGWDATWNVPNPYNLPITLVKFKNDTRDFSKYKECHGKCYECLGCWKMKPGEVIYFNKH